MQEQHVKWARALLQRRPFGSQRIEVKNGRPDYAAILEAYKGAMPEIMEADKWSDPYFVDWLPLFTPIERDMWGLIRSQHVPFYPQFPVGRFFLDFANPHRRVAIECDGRKWHDPEKDRKRDIELLDLGWNVVRISGRACLNLPRLPDVFSVPPLAGLDAFSPTLDEMLEADGEALE